MNRVATRICILTLQDYFIVVTKQTVNGKDPKPYLQFT